MVGSKEFEMFEFKIDYYFENYHTGSLNTDKFRKATVKAEDKEAAIEKIKQADNEFIQIKELKFNEIGGQK